MKVLLRAATSILLALAISLPLGVLRPSLVLAETLIPFGHKIAVASMAAGAPVIKYGEVIGVATAEIRPGQHVHVHNVRSDRAR